MRKILSYFLVVLFLVSCVTSPITRPNLSKIQFFDADEFDNQVLSSMSAGTETITVGMFGLTMPDRLNKILTVIGDSDGAIEPKSMGSRTTGAIIIGTAIFVRWIFKEAQKELAYRAAQNYDADIFVHPNSDPHKINRIVFKKRTL